MSSANNGGFRLVRCPKCLNILPEPLNVSVYQCGGCNTTLRVKIRVSNAQNVPTKQVRQGSDDYSVVTSVSNGVSPQNNEAGFTGAAMDSSCTPDAPSTETEHESNGTGSNENDDVMSAAKNIMEVANAENKEDCNFDGQDPNGKMEGPADLIHSNANGTNVDSDKEENDTVERSAENSEACRLIEEGDMECSLNASEHNMTLTEERKLAVNLPEHEQNGACKTQPAASKRCKLVRVQSRSCDLGEGPRASVESLDLQSTRTSFQSKSFRASEPLQSKIMKTVDDLRGDLSEFFNKPSDCKPRVHHPRPLKQDGYMPHVAITSNLPLTAYHPAAKHSSHASRLSRSGQVAPHGRPLQRYRRHGAYSCCHSGQMEMRSCSHECCHSCRPPCCRSWKQEPALQKPPAKEIKRRPPPRNLCWPVLRGAPFVLCSNCLRLVQLPTDFTVPSKGTRRLKCGSCSEVLSYSYRDPSRKKLQSPFGGDEYSTYDYETHQVSEDHGTSAHQAHPYSYSEEYGLSAGVSYSSEDEQPLHLSRNSYFNTIDEKNGKESKLHRLTGYSSASELVRYSPDLYESFSALTPNSRTYDRKGKGICMTDDDSGGEHGAIKKSKARSAGLPFQGILKKGIHGLESLKLRS